MGEKGKTMKTIGIDELGRIMSKCAGVSDAVSLDDGILDVSFADLGYDSVAMMEITAGVMREYGIELDETAEKAPTPRDFLALANARLQPV